MIVSRITPTTMMMDVPPNETLAPNTPLKKNGTTATIVSPAAPINIIYYNILFK